MAATDVIRARIDPKIKKKAAAHLKAMGMDMSTAMRLLAIRIAHDGKLPFHPHVPSGDTAQAMKDVRAGKHTKAKSVDDLLKVDDA